MSALSLPLNAVLTPPSPAAIDRLAKAQARILEFPQVEIATEHLLHGGMYSRTIRLRPGVVLMGSLIRLATVLILHGDCTVTNGNERFDLTGYNVLPGCARRKQMFLTRGPVEMTMVFPTSAKTVAEAEEEVFAEADQLISRKEGSPNAIAVTGE